MLQLEEIAKLPELKAFQDQFGKGEEGAERYLQAQKRSKNEGFIDPFSFSVNRKEVYETLRQIPLREVLGGGTGSDFMSYLIPTKIYQVLYDAFRDADITEDITGVSIRDFEGGTVQVVWGLVDKMRPDWYAEPGGPPIATEEVNRVGLSPKAFGMNLQISQSMIEDSQFELMEYHIRAAGREMGAFATRHVLARMFAGYDSTNNAVTSSTADAVTVADVVNAISKVENQGGMADSFVGISENKYDLATDTTTLNLALQWKEDVAGRYQLDNFLGLKWFWRRKETTNGLYSTAATDYYALVFEKEKGAAVAWKRPLTIKNYDHPWQGVAGATVSARIHAGALYDGDFIAVITEKD